MNEYDLRYAVMQADIKPTVKVVMLTILMKVDWHTWTNTITLKSIADFSKISYRSVQRALDELEAMGWITKCTQRIKAKNTPTRITVNHMDVFHSEVKPIKVNDDANLSYDKMSTGQNVLMDVDKMSYGIGQNVLMDSDKLTYNTIYNNINNNNNNRGNSDYEHYRTYYANYGFNIDDPHNADTLRADVLEYRLNQQPTWQRLNKFVNYAQAKDELLKRASWFDIKLGADTLKFIKHEIANEGATWKD